PRPRVHPPSTRGPPGSAPPPPGAAAASPPPAPSTGPGGGAPPPPLAVLAFMAMDYQFVRPLRVGDTVYGTSRVVSRRTMREGGIVIEDHEIIDQRGEVAQRGRFTFLVARRPA